MNLQRWYLNRMYTRVAKAMLIYGSSHHQMQLRRKWSPFKLLFGPFKYKFFHPWKEECRCDWEDVKERTPVVGRPRMGL